ncbi:MAG: ABC transporter permease subunit [Thermoanaerobaculia bacterium]
MSGLEFHQIGVRFGRTATGRCEALRDFTLHCPPGTISGLVGPNGAGKSTALAAAAGLLAPTAGRISVGGVPVDPAVAPTATGYLPQQSSFPRVLRVAEVLELALAARGAAAAVRRQVLAVTGLEAHLDRPVAELSGGWLRRLGLASALVTSGQSLLLLDEPFVGLDPDTLDRLVVHLRERAEDGAAVLVASHDFEVLDLLQPRVAVLDEGVLVGTVPEATGCRAVYRRYLSREPPAENATTTPRVATASASEPASVPAPEPAAAAEPVPEGSKRRHPVLLIARREVTLLRRGRTAWAAFGLLAAIAWLPALLVPLRAGAMGLAAFEETTLLTLALGGVVLPLLALLAGADLLAGEIEDGSLAPVLTLPVSRTACFLGKAVARAGLLGLVYLVSFVSAGVAVAVLQGADSWRDYAAVAVSGLFLCLACGGIGALLGAAGRGRLRAFSAALVTWLVLVVALDTLLLALVVAQAPAAPAEVGVHGHDELVAPAAPPFHDPHAHGDHRPETAAVTAGSPLIWLMLLDPVDVYRLTALSAAPSLRARLALALPSGGLSGRWLPLMAGWWVWWVVPPLLALWRFRRVGLK